MKYKKRPTKKVLIRFDEDIYKRVLKTAEFDRTTFTREVNDLLLWTLDYKESQIKKIKARRKQALATSTKKIPQNNHKSTTKEKAEEAMSLFSW